MSSRISEAEISAVYKQLLESDGMINSDDTALILYDLDFITQRVKNLKSLFPASALHAVAVKANPLFNILTKIKSMNVGLEAASLPELYMAKEAGLNPGNIVFDSPAKTIDELKYAMNLGCHINIDSFEELDRIACLLEDGLQTKSTFGIRINPQVGMGTIASTSVADLYSKFGIPLSENSEKLIEAYRKYDWLTGVHLHIGSQGCSLDMLINGIRTIYDFTEKLNEVLSAINPKRSINIFDIGGGLPVAHHKSGDGIKLHQYVDRIKEEFPQLFTDKYKLITEFGRYVHANAGWTASRVEYVKQGKNINTLMIHVGADMFLRKCYRPEDWHHEIFVMDKKGNLKEGSDTKKYNVAGPLCFAGDIIAREIELPPVETGDILVIQDTGAYTLSMWSRYNSRQIPKVFGYQKTDNGYNFEILRPRDTLDQVVSFWK